MQIKISKKIRVTNVGQRDKFKKSKFGGIFLIKRGKIKKKSELLLKNVIVEFEFAYRVWV